MTSLSGCYPVTSMDGLIVVDKPGGLTSHAVVGRVRLALPAAAALDVIPRTVGVHTPDGPGATIVETGGGSVAGLTRYLAGLPVPVEVLDPPELRASLRAHAAALAAANHPRP